MPKSSHTGIYVSLGLIILLSLGIWACKWSVYPIHAGDWATEDDPKPVIHLAKYRKAIIAYATSMENLAEGITDIRWTLIERRFDRIDKEARYRKWGTRPPRKGTSAWGRYQEWQYLFKNAVKLMTAPKAIFPMKKKLRKASYKPRWKK